MLRGRKGSQSAHAAQRLYTGRGYSFFKKAKGYYGDEDGYVMTRSLR